jgi:hypothetical protein
MKTLPILLLALCALSAHSFTPNAHAEVRRYLYCSTPDGAQVEGKSGTGIVIFDIDNDHKFVRRIDIPIFIEGLRGFTGCTETKSLYYSTTNRRLGCFDLESEKVVWDKQYDRGCDRSCITPDGKRIYAPSGWWYLADDSGMIVIDPKDGTLLETIPVNWMASLFTLEQRRRSPSSMRALAKHCRRFLPLAKSAYSLSLSPATTAGPTSAWASMWAWTSSI